MAKVILSERQFQQPQFLAQNGGYNSAYLYANKPGRHQMLSTGFFDNLWDGIGDFGTGLINIATGTVGAVGNIVTGAGQGIGSYVSNPNNIAQIGSAVTTGLTGLPFSFQNQPTGQQQYFNNQNDPMQTLLQNPLLLAGGAVLLYLIATKKSAK